jgi:hypothetical protein
MSRHDETIGRMPNPSQYFLEWNTEQNTFCYYSKEEEKSTPFALPFRFLCLKFMYSITGYNEANRQGIYSNEVKDSRLEHFRVKLRDGSYLNSGLYSDIKDDLVKAGGKFTRSIYAITPKGVVVNIRLKASQMQSFSSIEKFGNRWRDEWIQVSSFENKVYKAGDKEVNYTVPVFQFGGSINQADATNADKAYSLISDYFNSKPAQESTTSHSNPTPQPTAAASMPVPNYTPSPITNGTDDDLPF